ncbi:hypothetical protein, partial [Streptomyces sp. NPDC088812]|uniref:hypothetical protein n=1 Tax=Streptomyces sp. NPDC088812 TaxID=3365905 RepID=UPI0037F3AB2A
MDGTTCLLGATAVPDNITATSRRLMAGGGPSTVLVSRSAGEVVGGTAGEVAARAAAGQVGAGVDGRDVA